MDYLTSYLQDSHDRHHFTEEEMRLREARKLAQGHTAGRIQIYQTAGQTTMTDSLLDFLLNSCEDQMLLKSALLKTRLELQLHLY